MLKIRVLTIIDLHFALLSVSQIRIRKMLILYRPVIELGDLIFLRNDTESLPIVGVRFLIYPNSAKFAASPKLGF